MFKLITKYQTGDGKLHDSEAAAAKHIDTVIHDTFLRSLKACDRLPITLADRHYIVAMLSANRDIIRQALDLETFGSGEDE